MNRANRPFVQVLLTVLLTMIGVGISAFAGWLAEHPSPALASHAASLHTIGSAWLHVGAALVFAGIANQLVAPWFNFRDVIHGNGTFSDFSASERASLARTWAILTAAIILAIAWAGV